VNFARGVTKLRQKFGEEAVGGEVPGKLRDTDCQGFAALSNSASSARGLFTCPAGGSRQCCSVYWSTDVYFVFSHYHEDERKQFQQHLHRPAPKSLLRRS
jgi:hypothetical protein